jgi:hypothetical protein
MMSKTRFAVCTANQGAGEEDADAKAAKLETGLDTDDDDDDVGAGKRKGNFPLLGIGRCGPSQWWHPRPSFGTAPALMPRFPGAFVEQ